MFLDVIDQSAQAQVLQVLGLADAGAADQASAMQDVLYIAEQRMARLVPELLSQAQLAAIERLYNAGVDDSYVIGWVRAQLPDYDELAAAMVLDVAEEAMGGLRLDSPVAGSSE